MGNFGGESDDPFAFVVSNHTFYIPNSCVIPEWPISVSHRPVVHEGGGVGWGGGFHLTKTSFGDPCETHA